MEDRVGALVTAPWLLWCGVGRVVWRFRVVWGCSVGLLILIFNLKNSGPVFSFNTTNIYSEVDNNPVKLIEVVKFPNLIAKSIMLTKFSRNYF